MTTLQLAGFHSLRLFLSRRFRSQFKFLPASLDSNYNARRGDKPPAAVARHNYSQMPLDWFDSDDEDGEGDADFAEVSAQIPNAAYDPESNQGQSLLSAFIASEMGGDGTDMTEHEKKLLDERHKMLLFKSMLREGLKLTRIETKYMVPHGRRHLRAHLSEVDGELGGGGGAGGGGSGRQHRFENEDRLQDGVEETEIATTKIQEVYAKEAEANKTVLMRKIEGKTTTRRVNRVLQLTGDGTMLLWRPPKTDLEGSASPFEDGGANHIPKFDVLRMRKPKVAFHEGNHCREGHAGDAYHIIRIEFDRPRPKTRSAEFELGKVLRSGIKREFEEDFWKEKLKYPKVKVPKKDDETKFEFMKVRYLDDFALYCKVERLMEKLATVGITSAFDLCMANRALLERLVDKRVKSGRNNLQARTAAKIKTARAKMEDDGSSEDDILEAVSTLENDAVKELATCELLMVENDIPRLKGVGYAYSQTTHMDILCSDQEELKLLRTGFSCFYKYHAKALQTKAADPKLKLKKMVTIPKSYEARWSKNGYVPLTAQTLDENDDVKSVHIGCGKSLEDLALLASGTAMLSTFCFSVFGILLKSQLDGDETGLVLWAFFWMLLVVVGCVAAVFYLNRVDPTTLGLNEVVYETDHTSGRFLPVVKHPRAKTDVKGAIVEVKDLLFAGCGEKPELRMNMLLHKELGLFACMQMVLRELIAGSLDCLLYIVWKHAYYRPFVRISLIKYRLRPDGEIRARGFFEVAVFKVAPRLNFIATFTSNLVLYPLFWVADLWQMIAEKAPLLWFWILLGELFLLVLPWAYVMVTMLLLPENVDYAVAVVGGIIVRGGEAVVLACRRMFGFVCIESCAFVATNYKGKANTRKTASKNMGVTQVERRQRRLMKNKTRRQKLKAMEALNEEMKASV